MSESIDLDAYLRRIGHAGPLTPTWDTLSALVARHAAAIPFENLDPLLGRPVRLDAASLERKLVREGRGGYCFEHNLLLQHALHTLGYTVSGLAARVLWNVPEGVVTARGHMLLRVEFDEGPSIVDVGFGGMTPTAPLRVLPGVEQATPHEPFRLVVAGEAFVLQARLRGEWTPVYRFDLQEQQLADYQVTSWYLSNHPESHFVRGLTAARTDAGVRYTLRDQELAVHRPGGETERRVLASPAELRGALRDTFRIVLPAAPELDRALERLARGSEAPTGGPTGAKLDPVTHPPRAGLQQRQLSAR